jgi:hypothetical protein
MQQDFGSRVAARRSKCVGVGLAAPLGDGFGEVGKQHREPQPGSDLSREQQAITAGHEVTDEE